ncbi:MAG: lysine biosynthesis protein LysX [Candidatus Marinimicrobia bacterium]|nr:lysine biosynthesis protein LysX [Candidatus Neomarinimicrobiota bacterium]
MKLGFLFSRLRVEEKHLIKEIESRDDTKLVMLDSRKLVVDPKSNLNIDVLLDREISQSRALHLMQLLKNSHVQCINSYEVIRICGDKVFTSKALREAGVPTPEVKVAFTRESALKAIEDMGYPVVLKPVDGSWGRLIAKIENRTAAEAILEHKSYLSSYYHSIFYIQEYIHKPDRDIRALVLDGNTICATYRTSENWFTNVARGGKAIKCPLTPELEDICLKASQAVGDGALAIDLMETEDGYTVHEINCSMEFKGSMEAQSINIPGMIIYYCISQAKYN